MEIFVEVGTDEQKQLIIKELEVIIGFLGDKYVQSTELRKIIIPSDFQEEINRLEKIDTYKSERNLGGTGISARGKITKIEDGYAIVLSPLLYTENQDSYTRMLFIYHEIHHAVNRRDFPKTLNVPYVTGRYYETLYRLYDEYSSDCFAYRMIDKYCPVRSEVFENTISTTAEGLIELITNGACYFHIKNEILSFRDHANIELFIESTKDYVEEMATILAHTFSLFHRMPDRISRENLLLSPFVNEKTFAIMEYLKEKESKNEKNLNDGLDLMIGFLENFGIRFEYLDSQKYYIRVLDI